MQSYNIQRHVKIKTQEEPGNATPTYSKTISTVKQQEVTA